VPRQPVVARDGSYYVTDVEGHEHPITMFNLPISTLQEGWNPIGLQTGLPPFYILELHNENAKQPDTVWFLAENLDFVGNGPRTFCPDRIRIVVDALAPVV